MRTRGLAVAALVSLFVSGFVFQAWADKGDMRIQFGVQAVTPTDDLTVDDQTTELDEAFGFQAGFEYMVTNLIGVEPTIGLSSHDVEVEETGVPELALGEIDLFTLNANLNFHFLRESRLDLFAGLTVGYALWADLESDVFQMDFATDDEFIYGINLGLDVPFGDSRWEFAAALNYLLTDVSVEGSSSDIGVDPLALKIGASYKF
jgi:outer membrane protein W